MEKHHSMAPWLLLLLLLSLLSQSHGRPTNSTDTSLRLRLLHKNSRDSPFRTHYATESERLADILNSDASRVGGMHKMVSRTGPISAPLVSGASVGSGQYLVDFHVGTPPQKFMLVVDTGSDLLWVRCSGCRKHCLRRPGTAFFARRSATFSPIHCYAPECDLVPGPPDADCNATTRVHSACMYDYVYADLSDSSGVFARDTTTLNTSGGSMVRLPGIAFGCGMRSSGPSLTGRTFAGAQGVMGLGNGDISFASQIGRVRQMGARFSYCLVDYMMSPPAPSYLRLGRGAVPPHLRRAVRYTPLLPNKFAETFYYVGVRELWVGQRLLRLKPSVWSIDRRGNGGTVVDSGTTLTYLVQPAYKAAVAAFRRAVKYPRASVAGFELCYNVTGIRGLRLPAFRVVFEGGAALEPPSTNYFVAPYDDLRCLALRGVSSPSAFSIIGNLLQQNFFIVYDRHKSRIGFARTDCSRS